MKGYVIEIISYLPLTQELVLLRAMGHACIVLQTSTSSCLNQRRSYLVPTWAQLLPKQQSGVSGTSMCFPVGLPLIFTCVFLQNSPSYALEQSRWFTKLEGGISPKKNQKNTKNHHHKTTKQLTKSKKKSTSTLKQSKTWVCTNIHNYTVLRA